MTRLLIIGGSDAGISAGLRARLRDHLDLSYAPPLGSPYDAVQIAAREWLLTGAVAAAETRA